MNIKKFTLATIAYLLVSFALGFTWHLVFFKEAYEAFGVYTREPPIFAFGVGSMLLQGLILAYLYPLANPGRPPLLAGVRFSLVMGLFMWAVTVLAFAAKTNVSSMSTFFILSSLFHLIQFSVFGVVLGWIHARQ